MLGPQIFVSNALLDDMGAAGQWVIFGIAEFSALTNFTLMTFVVLKQTADIVLFYS